MTHISFYYLVVYKQDTAVLNINKEKENVVMEMENKYASRGVGNTALGLGIGAVAAQVLSGGLNGILNNGTATTCCSEDHYVSRYEASQAARISELETEVKLRDANTYTDSKILELYKYIDGKNSVIEAQICQQNVYNATNTAAINCMNGQIAQLMSLTKLVVPNSSVCPGWGDVTVSPATTPTTA